MTQLQEHIGEDLALFCEIRFVKHRVYLYAPYTEEICSWLHRNKFTVETSIFNYLIGRNDDYHGMEIRVQINCQK